MIEVRQATRRFGVRQVFTDLDLDVPQGVRLLLTGGNGAGKTTLLRCLAGTLALTSGRISVAGVPAGSPAARRLVGVCLAPEQGVYGRLSARDNLRVVARLRLPRRVVERATDGVIAELGIGGYADRPAEKCSAGMRARLTIARALLGDPAVLLLDEPTRSLDEPARALLWAALGRRREVACVIASHHAADRARCDATLDLAAGR
ncbi:ABC transporter ATP-binding protein [Micromonospora sp. WMMD882]|uniref:ABC transporter ATP-binding protein n=1 Tax=Micromonospora sp. WMMD882 TaxID=3015151 RepID=UPI00248CDF8A|nr:ABC transporter ATP-binding protein [Micromonospora sp. WMMD882]WBB82082.1 ABC transporter ATP-binding protein [Micromonospora sp. WMMD882]